MLQTKILMGSFLKVVRAFCVVVLCFQLVSCGGSDAGQVGDEVSLKNRVDTRWKSVMSHDYKKAYAYFSPEYRRLHSFDSFLSRVGNNVDWITVNIKDVHINGSYAKVQVGVKYSLKLPGSAGISFGADIGQIGKILEEDWVWRSGQWWYVDRPGSLK